MVIDIRITAPPKHSAARDFALEFLFRDLDSVSHNREPADSGHLSIELAEGGSARRLKIPEILLEKDQITDHAAIPSLPLEYDRSLTTRQIIGEPSLPLLFPTRRYASCGLIERVPEGIDLHADLLGGILFLIARLEEQAANIADAEGRYPVHESIAHTANFAQRPLADEYAAIIRYAMSRLWPRLRWQEGRPTLITTHDVDTPISGRQYSGLSANLRALAGDLAVRRSTELARFRFLTRLAGASARRIRRDPYFNFPALMDLDEEYADEAAIFFFQVSGHNHHRDCRYELEEPWIRDLMSQISSRGHMIGLHGSYMTLSDCDLMATEIAAIRTNAAALGIQQEHFPNRQHWLRWRAPESWLCWEALGIGQDSSMGYSDRIGFRSGTSRPHKLFDIKGGRALRVQEFPMAIMDVGLASMDSAESGDELERIAKLAERSARWGGTLVVNFHNNYMWNAARLDRYATILQICRERIRFKAVPTGLEL